jgi:cAMP-specific phosphodiesterase 4
MAVHSKMLAKARVELNSGDFWEGPDAEGRLLAMQALVHTADLSNACRPSARAGMWTRAVYDEFFRQGDAEKEMQLEVSPLCDRDSVAIAESQVRHPCIAEHLAFIDHV